MLLSLGLKVEGCCMCKFSLYFGYIRFLCFMDRSIFGYIPF